jgi:hypothetical protein
MARTQRHLSTLALGLALGLAYCSGGDAGKVDDPSGVNERVRTMVSRFSYGAGGPYAASAGGNVFSPAQGGPFEGSDSAGVIGPPALNGGVYDRADFCSSACQLVASCLGAGVPSDCASGCNEQVQLVASRFGNGCLGPLVDLYSCFLGSLVCSRGVSGDDDDGDDDDGDDDGDDGAPLSVSSDVGERCAPAAQSVLSCANRSNLGDLFGDDDDDDDGSGMGSAGSAAGNGNNGNGGSDNAGSSSGGNGGNGGSSGG